MIAGLNPNAPLLRQVAARHDDLLEVGIAKHLVDINEGSADRSEVMLRDSLQVPENLHDTFGVAQFKRSLANLLTKQPRARWDEAETLYGDSLRIGEELGRELHVAQVAFKYGDFLCTEGKDVTAGLLLLRQSLEINQQRHSGFADLVSDTIERYASPGEMDGDE